METPLATSPVDGRAKFNMDAAIVAAQNQSLVRPAVSEAASATASPNPTELSASTTRRGLRTRRPAQQRPYYHDAQLFDDVETATSDPEEMSTMSPESRSRRTSAVSFVGKIYDNELLAQLDAEALAILQDSGDDHDAAQRRPRSFKGKGRAWKKEESDDDEEFSVAKKKAAKAARAKAKAQGQQVITVPKKRGRPRKHMPPTDSIHDRVHSPASASTTTSPSRAKDGTVTKKPRKPARKSTLSAEIIQDSESEELMNDAGDADDADIHPTTLSVAHAPSIAPPGDAKPRPSTKSLTLSISFNRGIKDGGGYVDRPPATTSNTPAASPERSYTPAGSPEPSYTPTASPARRRSTSPAAHDDDNDHHHHQHHQHHALRSPSPLDPAPDDANNNTNDKSMYPPRLEHEVSPLLCKQRSHAPLPLLVASTSLANHPPFPRIFMSLLPAFGLDAREADIRYYCVGWLGHAPLFLSLFSLSSLSLSLSLFPIAMSL